ncbi:hypothetical protein [Vibrio mangrovi]|uniref:Uncharacterized protein n=1 Tax=Vibrio mangrovi TaxID=474394 RepID=A0ABU4I4P8_9VIBR|nr:hypothetical protein [Vibrio mangrovi]MDW6002748.1 hypothetical protein [Vibrio mangrovi]
MLSQRHWFTILLITLLCISLFYFFLHIKLTTPTEISDREKSEENIRLPSHEQINSPVLSRDAEYPSPVIQLQQTVTDGLLQDTHNHLPLLHGDLADFSQKNIRKQYSQPDELIDLKQRLQQLKSVAHPAP